ncbi:MAG TPA: hypothetical protein VFM54_02220 [Micromonosporaceae bacterium]|nr:hypothetical protein [Micromonosporaceae bacterium]
MTDGIAALAAALTDRLGVVTVLTAQALAYVVAGVAFAVLVRRSRPAPAAPPPRPEPVGARQYE